MDRRARNDMIVQNLPLVGYLVNEVAARATHLSRDDLASVGAVALVQAAEAFDPAQGVPFGAYARTRIVGAFADDMRAGDWASRGTRKRIKETLAVQDSLTAALGRTPSVDEIAGALGVDRQTASDALVDAARTVSALDDSVGEHLAADLPLPEEQALVAERSRFVRAAVEALPERMRLVVEGVYFGDRTVKDLAAELGITHSAVSQQRAEAVRLLRDAIATHYADEPEAVVEAASTASVARRSAYLSRVAANAAVGVARALREPESSRGLSAAV